MADKPDRIDELVEEAQTGRKPGTAPPDEKRRLPRGRVGTGRSKSPRKGVRDPGPAREGEHGEPAYGAPLETPKPDPERKRRKAKPDPLKPKN